MRGDCHFPGGRSPKAQAPRAEVGRGVRHRSRGLEERLCSRKQNRRTLGWGGAVAAPTARLPPPSRSGCFSKEPTGPRPRAVWASGSLAPARLPPLRWLLKPLPPPPRPLPQCHPHPTHPASTREPRFPENTKEQESRACCSDSPLPQPLPGLVPTRPAGPPAPPLSPGPGSCPKRLSFPPVNQLLPLLPKLPIRANHSRRRGAPLHVTAASASPSQKTWLERSNFILSPSASMNAPTWDRAHAVCQIVALWSTKPQ